jgi:3-deoxy-manno-octulosonate cytidylyltransferase (CMP-KDO synthetase)
MLCIYLIWFNIPEKLIKQGLFIMSSTVIVIPARMEATRLPGKPLILVDGKPMIVHMVEAAMKMNIGDVVVACAEEEIKDVVERTGCRAVMTDPRHPSGSDRVHEAIVKSDPYKRWNKIINLPVNIPFTDLSFLKKISKALDDGETEIVTMISELQSQKQRKSRNIIKCDAKKSDATKFFNLSNFTRLYDDSKEVYRHLGVYGYKRNALEKFVSMPMSNLEKKEGLEQMRAVENKMKLSAMKIEKSPFTVNTSDDLEKIERLVRDKYKNKLK